MNTLELAQKRVKLIKVASTHGGEWQGPCPGCGGNNRFHVWPEQQDGKGSYWCRTESGCGKAGDNIQFLIDFEGMDFRQACAYLKIDIPDRPEGYRPAPPSREKNEFTPREHTRPADLWQEKAENFVAWAQANLAGKDQVLKWLAERGIDASAVNDYRLGWNPGENGKDYYRARKAWGLPEQFREDKKPKALWIPIGLVIPCIVDGVVHRIRIRRPEGEPRYYVLAGSSMSAMIVEPARRAFVVVEAELDAIAIGVNNRLAGAVALGSVSAKPDAVACEVLQGALQIMNALDYDAAGAKAAAWWKEHFPRCDRWPVPRGKDPGEAYRMGIDLEQWIIAGLPPALTIGVKPAAREPEPKSENREHDTEAPGDCVPSPEAADIPPTIRELHVLLKNNPTVKIINTPDRMTVLRHGKWVGGRIGDLVFRDAAVRDYILTHPAQEIDGANLIIQEATNGN